SNLLPDKLDDETQSRSASALRWPNGSRSLPHARFSLHALRCVSSAADERCKVRGRGVDLRGRPERRLRRRNWYATCLFEEVNDSPMRPRHKRKNGGK